MLRAFSTDSKHNNQKQSYNNSFQDKHIKSKNRFCSPEKECSDINEIVKQSVDKINNLLNNQKLINKINQKKVELSPNINLNNKLNNKANFTFNINNFINVRKEDKDNINNQKNKLKNESNNKLEDKEKKDIKKFQFYKNNRKKLSLSHQVIDDKKNNDKIKIEDDLNENYGYNFNKNNNSMIDISVLKRNIKKHAINISFNHLNQEKKETKNQIDYINQSNQNQKKYIIKNSFNLNNSKKANIIQKIETTINFSPLFKKNFSFNSKSKKDLNITENSTENNIQKNKFNRRKFYNLRKYQFLKKNIKISNSTKNLNQKQIFEPQYKRTSSTMNKKIKEKRNFFSKLKEKSSNDSTKKSIELNLNNKIQNIKKSKIFSSTPIIKGQSGIYRNKSQKHFNKSNNNREILKKLYSKEFPSKIKTNEVLKLMLFLNEYIINNNFLDDYYIPENQKNLADFSKLLASKINLNYPQENDIDFDNYVSKAKIIQRKWRKRKVNKYLK